MSETNNKVLLSEAKNGSYKIPMTNDKNPKYDLEEELV